MNYVAKYHE